MQKQLSWIAVSSMSTSKFGLLIEVGGWVVKDVYSKTFKNTRKYPNSVLAFSQSYFEIWMYEHKH